MVDSKKKEIEKKISEIKEQLEDNIKMENRYIKRMGNIEKYFNLKKQVFNLELGFWCLATIGSMFVLAPIIIQNIKLLVFIEVIIGISLVTVPTYISKRMDEINKHLKDDYNNLYSLSNQELSNQYEILSFERQKISDEYVILNEKKSMYEEKLKEYNTNQQLLEKNDIVQSFGQEERKNPDNYLLSLPVYYNINYVNSIEGNIQYSENSKKLLKKM